MAIIKTDCSCGEQHEFEKDIIKKMQWDDAPEFIECSECPVCSPDLLDTPEDHEDEAYKEEVDIEELEKALEEEDFSDIEEFNENFDEEEY